jgi:polygalacturonase
MRTAVLFAVLSSSSASVFDIRACGAVANSIEHNVTNAVAIKGCIANATAGDTVLVPAGQTFHAVGGISGTHVKGVTIRVDGILSAVADLDHWPLVNSKFLDFLSCVGCSDLTINGNGTIDGKGLKWWNTWVEDQQPKGSHRPHLVYLTSCTDVLVEDITMLNSPNFHLRLDNNERAEVRFITIEVNRKEIRKVKKRKRELRLRALHGLSKSEALPPYIASLRDSPVLQPEDLNTDGIDPSGRDIWIHDSYINNDDDSIAVKPCKRSRCSFSECSQNMLIENMVLSGFGASIGSVPADTVHAGDTPNCVRNITFRNISMPETGKGVYIKSNPSCQNLNASAIIRDIVFEVSQRLRV